MCNRGCKSETGLENYSWVHIRTFYLVFFTIVHPKPDPRATQDISLFNEAVVNVFRHRARDSYYED